MGFDAIDIYRVMPDFISGKRKDSQGRGIENWENIGGAPSPNIAAGKAVNEAFYVYHHREKDIPKMANAIRGWIRFPTFLSEQFCSFIYGDWLVRDYKAFYAWAQLVGDADLEAGLADHLLNIHLVLALASTGVKRQTPQSAGFQTLACGNRSWVADRPKGQKSYVVQSGPHKGEWLEANNLDYCGLDAHLNDELGYAPYKKGQRNMADAIGKLGASHRSLTIEERAVLRDITEWKQTEEQLRWASRQLNDGPNVVFPIDILRTTRGAAFVMREGKGGSTCCLPARIFYSIQNEAIGPWNKIWWPIQANFGWLSTDKPARKAGRKATAEIHDTPHGFEVRARSSKKDHYDVARKEFVKGDTTAPVPGKITYLIQWDQHGCALELPGGVVDSGTPPLEEAGGCILTGLLGR